MKTQSRPALFVLAVIALMAARCTSRANANEPETVEVTFTLWIPFSELSDDNGDGIPELPDLSGNEFVGVVFQAVQETAGDTLTFADSSDPCGPFPIRGTSWSRSSAALLVGKRGPANAGCYGSGVFPPERGFLQASKVIAAHACWYTLAGGVLYTQTEIDGATYGAVVVMTGEFRLADLF